MQKEYIKIEAWIKMLKFFTNNKKVYVGKEGELKLFIEAIFWVTRTGAQWREIPEKYGLWNSIYVRFNEWSKKGIWDELFEFCKDDPDLEYVMLDSTIVRAHACAAGYGSQLDAGLGRSRGGFTTKIHTLTEALGNPLKFIVAPGQSSDIAYANELIGSIKGEYGIGDRGYDSDVLRHDFIKNGIIPVIPYRSNRKNPCAYDKHIYKERHAIECFFSKIKHFRRVFARFEKSIRNFRSILCFVGAILWLR